VLLLQGFYFVLHFGNGLIRLTISVFYYIAAYFATCSMDKTVKIWDAKTFRLLKVIDRARHAGHGTSVNKLFWPARVNSLVSCSDDRTISVWDLNFNLRYENNTIRNQAEDL
jgi:WD40 repeat protein